MRRAFTVEENTTLLAFLYEKVSGMPRERIKIQLKRGEVRICGKKCISDCELSVGDVVEIFIPAKFEIPKIEIVYEDDNILVVDKPVLVESERQLPELIERDTGKKVMAVHRLDTNTTGLMITAKTDIARETLISAFSRGEILKTYHALVVGVPKPDSGRLTAYMLKHDSDSYCSVYSIPREGTKPIVTEYETVKGGKISVVKLSPITGRTHQLRAHLAFMGYPILGDDKYGNREINAERKVRYQQLRATQIEFGRLESPLEYLRGKKISVNLGKEISDFLD